MSWPLLLFTLFGHRILAQAVGKSWVGFIVILYLIGQIYVTTAITKGTVNGAKDEKQRMCILSRTYNFAYRLWETV